MKVTVSEVINTEADKLFDACSNENKLSVWFTTNASVDFRTGGRYSNSDLDEGEFIEIIKNKLIKFSWENKNHCPGTEVTFRFSEIEPGRTKIIITHDLLDSTQHVNEMNEGWSWAVHSLKSYIETGNPVKFEDWKKSQSRTFDKE